MRTERRPLKLTSAEERSLLAALAWMLEPGGLQRRNVVEIYRGSAVTRWRFSKRTLEQLRRRILRRTAR